MYLRFRYLLIYLSSILRQSNYATAICVPPSLSFTLPYPCLLRVLPTYHLPNMNIKMEMSVILPHLFDVSIKILLFRESHEFYVGSILFSILQSSFEYFNLDFLLWRIHRLTQIPAKGRKRFIFILLYFFPRIRSMESFILMTWREFLISRE